jgi:ribosome modulation factor
MSAPDSQQPPEGRSTPCGGSAFLRTIVEGLAVVACFETLDECYQQGQAASSQAYGRDQNPYPKGTARREWWDGGWSNELDELCGER